MRAPLLLHACGDLSHMPCDTIPHMHACGLLCCMPCRGQSLYGPVHTLRHTLPWQLAIDRTGQAIDLHNRNQLKDGHYSSATVRWLDFMPRPSPSDRDMTSPSTQVCR